MTDVSDDVPWNAETKAAFWRQADTIRSYQHVCDSLRAERDNVHRVLGGTHDSRTLQSLAKAVVDENARLRYLLRDFLASARQDEIVGGRLALLVDRVEEILNG